MLVGHAPGVEQQPHDEHGQAGAFEGGLCGPTGMTGAVARSGVTINTKCKTGDTPGDTVLVLSPTDDYKLVGEARNDRGQTARVELPLM